MPNSVPEANAVEVTTEESTPLQISADFTDADASDSHVFSMDDAGTLGTVTNNNDGTFGYDPAGAFEHLAAGETATDSFTYTVDDGNGGVATETVTVTITGSNDGPVANPVAAAASENGAAVTISADFTDVDVSDSHSFSVDTTGTLGSVTNNNDGTFSYDPAGAFEHLAAGETATDSFTYTVDDGNGGSATETVTVTITGSNDGPVASASTVLVDEDAWSIVFEPDFSDVDAGDTHTISFDFSGALPGTEGAVTDNGDGTYTYTVQNDYDFLAVGETVEETAFTYTVTDSQGASSTNTVSVVIEGRNDAPVASAVSAIAEEDGPAVTVTADYSDVDLSDTHTFTVDTSGTLGLVTNNGDGTFTYHPNDQFEHLIPGETATDTFSYTVHDGHGGTATETVTITIEGQVEAEKLVASDGASSDYFGHSTAINELGFVLVGAHGDDGRGDASGIAYLYRPLSGGGYEKIKLSASDGAYQDLYGYDVALNNAGVAVVGAHGNGSGRGAVYVYQPDGAGGYLQTKLAPAGLAANDRFGISPTINENGVIAVGAIGQTVDGKSSAGSVYVYSPDGFGGYDEVKLTASDAMAGDFLGREMAINDAGVIVAGATNGDGAVANSGAVYVFAPDGQGGYTEIKLTASDGQGGDQFGAAVGIGNDGTVVVGAHYDSVGGQSKSGSVYVYQPVGDGTYTEVKLHALDGFAGDQFGSSIAVNDDGVIVVGAVGDDDADAGAGAAYAFVPDGNGGYLHFKLTAPDAANGDGFGQSVDINSDGVISVGAWRGDGNAGDSGAVYTFVPDGNGNYEGPDGTIYSGVPADGSATNPVSGDGYTAGKIIATDGLGSDYFGYSTAINETGVVLVGANGDDDRADSSGVAYLYRPLAGGGYEEIKLSAADGAYHDKFGYDVSLNNAGVAVIGATGDGSGRGAVYVYRPDGSGGYFETKIVPDGLIANDRFGISPTINETGVIAVGAIGQTVDGKSSAGSVYVYSPDGFGGYDEIRLTASDPAAADFLGREVAINDAGVVVAGATNGDGAVANSGAVYVFAPDGQGGYTETKLTASDGLGTDQFGAAVGIGNDGTVVVGARYDDDGLSQSGSVYVYQPVGDGTYTETKLRALDADIGDQFGTNVAINDDGVIVVGAVGDDGVAAGAGAAYAFIPDGSGGYLEVKLTAPDALKGDGFGQSVDINSDGVISVGAWRGDGNAVDSGAVYTFVPDGSGNYEGPDGTIYSAVPASGFQANPQSAAFLDMSIAEPQAADGDSFLFKSIAGQADTKANMDGGDKAETDHFDRLTLPEIDPNLLSFETPEYQQTGDDHQPVDPGLIDF